MKEIPGGKGGVIRLMEKGDPSPKKGHRYVSTSALLANCRREKRPKLDPKRHTEAVKYLLEMTEDDWKKLLEAGLLTGALAVEVRSWLDRYHGPENLRRSWERVFGKPAEHIDHTTAGQPVTSVFAELLMKTGQTDDGTEH